jgi:hypothetical protein
MTDTVETINSLLQIQGLDLAKDVFDHNSLGNFLIECRDEIERLKEENFALAAWSCIHSDGKTGIVNDEYGNQYCAKDAEIEQLTSGPGGIMEMKLHYHVEMKQTIADKEAEIEQLRNALRVVSEEFKSALDDFNKEALQSKETAVAALQRHGLLDENRQLAKRYRDDEESE